MLKTRFMSLVALGDFIERLSLEAGLNKRLRVTLNQGITLKDN